MDAGRAPVGEPARGRQGRRAGESERLRVPPRTVDQILAEEDGDVVEHERGNDLARPEPGPQRPRDQPPKTAAEQTGGDHGRHHDPAGGTGDHEEGQPGGEDGSPVDLPFSADIPELHAKRDGDT